MIAVEVASLQRSVAGCVVLLKSATDHRQLQVVIGDNEAQAILIRIKGVGVPRPLTHDLMRNLLEVLDCEVVRVEICDLRDNVFYGRIILRQGDVERECDSRPSDAIALALRCDAPIFVDEAVMESAGYVPPDEEDDTAPEEAAPAAARPSRKLSPQEALRNRLSKAIGEENYEQAAIIRDKLRELEGGATEGATED